VKWIGDTFQTTASSNQATTTSYLRRDILESSFDATLLLVFSTLSLLLAAMSMGNGPDGLFVPDTRYRAAIHNLEDASCGSGCGVGRLVENAPQVPLAQPQPLLSV
jgi:hypothetical protein